MGNIKRRANKGFILLESLIAMSMLTMITAFMLTEVNQSQKQSHQMNQQIEALNVSKMALDTGQSDLTANGVSVEISKNEHALKISDEEGKEVLTLEILELQK